MAQAVDLALHPLSAGNLAFAEVEEQFPLSDADRQAFQEDLRALLLRLYTEELAATEALAAAIA